VKTQGKHFNVEGYLERLAKGGVSICVIGDNVSALPAMDNGQPVPEGTLRNLQTHAKEIAEFYDESYVYPFLTESEIELSELVLDMLEPEELERLDRHKAMLRPSDSQTAEDSIESRRVPTVLRARGAAKRDAREFHPPYHETPQDKRLRGVVEGLERLSATLQRVSESEWSFEAGDSIKWVKRTKTDGTKSVHFIRLDAETGEYVCDCTYKSVRPNDACVHELARTEELKRRSNG